MSRNGRSTSDKRRPRHGLGAAATLALAAPAVGSVSSAVIYFAPASTAWAQTAPADVPRAAEDAAKRKLETQKSELAAKEARDQELQNDLANITDQRREINARLVETAALVQRSEEQMTAIETRLAGFEKQERAVREQLAKEHGKISGILAALQRMGRNPPPVIITRREDALAMVRSAMLLGITFPGLREEAKILSTRLNELVGIMTSIRREGDNLRAERDRLSITQARLASLLETKKQSLAERQAELKKVRDATAEISKNVTDLSELISKLSQQVTAAPPAAPAPAEPEIAAVPSGPALAPGLMPPPDKPASDQVVAVLPPAATAPPVAGAEPVAVAREAAIATPPQATPKRGEEVALVSPPSTRETPPSIVELAPAATSIMPGSPDRIAPSVPFQLAKGKLPLPARGRRALGFGDKTQYGGTSKGLVIETRYGARVTAPCDGWVVYAGEFRSYGQLLIINAGGGYHVLVAGLSQMDVGPGQFVLAAEPIGTMSGAPRTAQLASDKGGTGQSAPQSGAPVLYIEFRKDGQPINSDPWWVASLEKVQE